MICLTYLLHEYSVQCKVTNLQFLYLVTGLWKKDSSV